MDVTAWIVGGGVAVLVAAIVGATKFLLPDDPTNPTKSVNITRLYALVLGLVLQEADYLLRASAITGEGLERAAALGLGAGVTAILVYHAGKEDVWSFLGGAFGGLGSSGPTTTTRTSDTGLARIAIPPLPTATLGDYKGMVSATLPVPATLPPPATGTDAGQVNVYPPTEVPHG